MNKNETIAFLKEEHAYLYAIIDSLNKEELVQYHIVKAWTIKDIVAHIAAWNKELTKAISLILDKKDIWFRTKSEEEFNKIQVALRRPRSTTEVLEEWKKSFTEMIEIIENLSEAEWNFDPGFYWKSGNPVTIKSLYEYRKRGYGHEGWHAFQIEDYFDSDRCACRVY